MMKAQRLEQGFTLIELMVVVGLIGVIAYLAFPNLTGAYARAQVAGAARSLFSAFGEAKALAQQTGKVHCLTLSRTDSNFSLLRDDDNDNACETPIRSEVLGTYVGFGPEDGVANAFDAPYDTVPHTSWCSFCEEDTGTLAFRPDGSLIQDDASGSFSVHDPSGASASIHSLVYISLTGDFRLFSVN